MVIFLFLRNLSATAIPSMALPMSIVGTFAVMYLLGYSLDNLSLMALTLSVGFVVDDAIVMLENIVRHMEQGKPPLLAALDGSKEISFTIVSMTLSLAAVFLPVLFMGGLVGRLLHEFAVTIGVAILVSGFVSLTLTPMLCSRFLKAHGRASHGRWYQASERAFEASLRAYDWSLKLALRHRRATMVASGAVLVATVWLFKIMPTGFLPSEDINQAFAFTEAAEGISFEEMARHQQALAAIVGEDPNVEAYMSSIGATGPNSTANSGRIFMRLKPRAERALSAAEVIEELRPKLGRVPGIRAFLQIPPPIRIGGTLTKSLYQLTLQGPDTDELYKYAPVLEEKLRAMRGLQDVTSDLQIKNPQLTSHRPRQGDRARPQRAAGGRALYLPTARWVSTIYAQQRVSGSVGWPRYQREPRPGRALRALVRRLVPLEAWPAHGRPASVATSGSYRGHPVLRGRE
jgi:HAE1 family hydrophobic/amphiphilic exporter-1